jgi:hypothetical protein
MLFLSYLAVSVAIVVIPSPSREREPEPDTLHVVSELPTSFALT